LASSGNKVSIIKNKETNERRKKMKNFVEDKFVSFMCARV